MKPDVHAFFDEATNTVSYAVADPATGTAALIDPVLDFDPKSGRTGTASADRLIGHVRGRGLTVDWILETHVHADHLSAAAYVKGAVGGRIGIGEHIRQVQEVFKALFNMEPGFVADGGQFDHLFADGERFRIGSIDARALHTPGHTPADLTYVVGDAAFVGDTLFQPDYGTARTDFPGGDARSLYRSIRRILDLPPHTRLFTGHDYKPPGRDRYLWESTVAEQRADNVHVRDGVTEEEFVAMRTARDAKLQMPALILPSVQVNVRGGQFPPAEDNGVRYLKIPIDAL
ncbi:MBL fold metallo-hydrolase [Arenibaculum sp.]|jgi:glyoxylase-like metal-dependent hydrolase (beta-lactamase superfamily II)|uniref:MBL fold metallo-hydrolase n=1 Tax=Arenibaculum sp. TaxID=2865862 RepID=UPI002E11134A|nr:MBL fold metallo-hydrolase [Arenibaculum sp.]